MFRIADIPNHATQLRLLSAWVENPAPGYVFIGPGHLGKRLIAERFVLALLGLDQDTLPQAHADLIVLEAEEGKSIVSVERVREVRARLSEKPMVASRVVVYISALDRLNEEGMNALLKVLEEPPADAVFVCLAESLLRLPATVRSRLVVLTFLPGAKEKWSAATGEYETLARGFLSAKTLGERLSILDALVKVCDSSDNTVQTWINALDEWSDVFRLSLKTDSVRTLVAAQGVIVARTMVGGALPPRLALDAAALRLSEADPLSNLFPSHLASPFRSIFLLPT
ncbi:MAG: hypothetical protein WC787_00935 [Patescibacteria group bacterium]|jgi:hypothetical protein